MKLKVGFLNCYVFDNNFESSLDKKSNLLPIQNNLVVDLKTGLVEPRTKEHLFSHECNISLGNNKDKRKEVEQFFMTIANDNEDLYKVYQTILGLCLTGEIEKIIIIFFGKGNNGKSVIARILERILGKFCQSLNDSVFAESQLGSSANAHTSHLNCLIGSRVGISSELNDREKFNISLLNKISGGDIFTNRSCNSSIIQQVKSHTKLILMTNDIPKFPPEKQAFIQRLYPINFPVKFVEYKEGVVLDKNEKYKDIDLCFKMENDQEYLNELFSWMINGSKRYYDSGLYTPIIIQNFKKECVFNNDVLLQFLNENLIVNMEGFIAVKKIYLKFIEGTNDYKNYQITGTVVPKKLTMFADSLRKKGYEIKIINRINHVLNYSLIDAENDDIF